MEEPLQKLAIVLQIASTGGWRYVQRLVEGLKQARPQLKITCYLGAPLLETFASDQPRATLEALGVQVFAWPEIPEAPPAKKFRPLRAYRHRRATAEFQRWLDQLNGFDAIFFAWPYGLACPALTCPIFFIPHDFNYLHFAGSWTMAAADASVQRAMHVQWLRCGTPIVSTQFIAQELADNFAAELRAPPEVIPLTRLSKEARLPDAQAAEIVRHLGITGPYVLSPNNVAHHKNFGQVLGAFHYVQLRHPDWQLVVCGHNTAGITGYLRTPLYVDRVEGTASTDKRPHVLSVGMRSDREVAALIQCARLVINASLYEAGNGSGLDAWSLGTPVAMSNIPAFVEHIGTLGVRAELFHPRDCFDIRDAMCRLIEEPDRAREMAAASQAAINRYTWIDVARRYLQVFDGGLTSIRKGT